MVKTDEDYQAEWDAQTLADAEQIKADQDRMARAGKAAKRLAEEKEKENRAMRKVAGKRTGPLQPSVRRSGMPSKVEPPIAATNSFTSGKVKSGGVTTFIG